MERGPEHQNACSEPSTSGYQACSMSAQQARQAWAIPDAGKLLVAGGVSGVLAKTATAPLGRLTILYQVQALAPSTPRAFSAHASPMAALAGGRSSLAQVLRPAATPRVAASSQMPLLAAVKHVVRTEGVMSLWKGNLATVLHRLPYSAVNFTTFELMDQGLSDGPLSAPARRFVAGAAAGVAGCVAAYPLDLLRTLLAAQTAPSHHPRAIASSGTRHVPVQQSSSGRSGSSSSSSGGGGSARAPSTHPSSSMVTAPAARSSARGMIDAARTIVAQDGVLGLYRGLGATLAQVTPSLACHFMFYATLKDALASNASAEPASRVQPLQQQQQQQHRHQHNYHQRPLQQESPSASPLSLPSSVTSSACSPAVSTSTPSSAPSISSWVLSMGVLSPSTLAAALAAVATSTITFPLDKVRRVIQVQGSPSAHVVLGMSGRLGWWAVCRGIWSQGGVRAFYDGIAAEYIKVVPGMIVAFSTFETMKEVLGVGADAGTGAAPAASGGRQQSGHQHHRQQHDWQVASQHAVGLEEGMESGILNE